MLKRLVFYLIFFCLVTGEVAAQGAELSEESSISLLTCGPGPEVYSYFGHSALRVADPVLKIDRVYNYGTFDFSVPNFYTQFIDGKLYYMLSVVRFKAFLPDYMSENRFIKELPLNISLEERRELFRLLEVNYLPENRHYWYDFFKDNCSSRIRDIVMQATGGVYQWPAEPDNKLTYRELILPYISLSRWARTGILLMLTAGADEEVPLTGYMFLPDHLHSLFAQAKKADGSPLCQAEKVLFLPEYPKPKGGGLVHPYFILSLVLAASLAIGFVRKAPAWLRKSFQSLLFAIAGLLGLLFSYMWFFSGHVVCHGNLNLFWAFPLTIVMAVTVWIPKASGFNRIYSRVMLSALIIFLATFAFWRQRIPLEAILFSLALVPGFLGYAGLNILRKGKTQDQAN